VGLSEPGAIQLERLRLPATATELDELASLLLDAVESGAAVSFVLPLTRDAARAFWQTTLSDAHPRAIFLVARQGSRIVGTVQLHPAWAPNQPHRAELAKLLVHRDAQRHGLGAALMQRAEDEARRAGFTLLTLDAKRGGSAERLYLRLGWTRVGVIPRYALDADGQGWHDTVVFYKDLASPS
jgi:GNAT superfamily N-acetyltransferase